jgi:hypothetical protein
MHPYKCPDIPSSQPNKLLSVEALERAQTLARQIADLAYSRRQRLESDPRARVWLSIVGAPSPSNGGKIWPIWRSSLVRRRGSQRRAK